MLQDHSVAVLGVCIGQPQGVDCVEGLTYQATNSARQAIDVLCMHHFDFALINWNLPDMSTWDFLRRLKTAWPQQKWALVGGSITQQQETSARMFGVTALFDIAPSGYDLLNLARRFRERTEPDVLGRGLGRMVSRVARRAGVVSNASL